MMGEYGMFSMTIGGASVSAAASLGVVNPANGEVFAEAPDASREDLDRAVNAARQALPKWRATPHAERAGLLKQAAGILMENADMLMRLLTREQGKTHANAQAEVMGAAYWLGAMADMEIPVIVNEDTPERLSETVRVPVGVVAGISPWNFPVLLSFWKIAPALAAGNTMVLKP